MTDPSDDEFNGTMVLRDNASLNFAAGTLWKVGSGGELRTEGAGAQFSGRDLELTSIGATLRGEGQILSDVISRGLVSPGISLGTLAVESYTQFNDGTLRIEIGGTGPGRHDRLVIGDQMQLDGTLEIELVAGYSPAQGDVVTFMTYAGESGDFAQVLGLDFGSGAGQFFHRLYFADHMALYVPLLGDANFDGQVSSADYTLWADHFGSGSLWSQGDFNGDGRVTGADYTLWADSFGQSVSLDPQQAVPEPATLLLAAIVSAASLLRAGMSNTKARSAGR